MKIKSYDAFAIGEGSALSISLQVPENPSEFNLLAKAKPDTDPCCDCAVDYEVYHGTLEDVRYYFAELLEKRLTEEFPNHPVLKRKTKETGKKDKDGNPSTVYAEAAVAYARRALAELASLRGVDTVPITEFQPLLDSLQKEYETDNDGKTLYFDEDGNSSTDEAKGSPRLKIRFDPSVKERGERQPKTLPKIYLLSAGKIFDAGNAQKFMDKWSITVVIPDGTDEAKTKELTVEAIAKKIKSLEDAERAEREKNLADKYAA